MNPLLLTVEQVAELLQVSRWFVYDHPDELGLVKLGKANRYRREKVEEYIVECSSRPPPSVPSPSPPALRAVPTSEPLATARRRSPRRVPLLEPGGRAA